ncbi:MAG TPA: chromosomal replication initiator protein DnaA, partial [Chloroflexi bacterium]|nr:chromosomal replication initiator protein DnaA [Chloroflexota bacterium]
MAERNMQAAQVWQAALGELQLQMTKPTFDTWLKNTSLISYEDGTFVIGVHNAYAKDWLENRLLSIIKRALVGIVGRSVEVKFVVWPRERAASKRSAGTQELGPLLSGDKELTLTPPRAKSPAMLNPKYTFETFVVGPSNRLAHAASLAVAENPADAYNPLFIYGGVGLGKTHLLQAIGHVCQRKALRVLYVSSEEFTNDLINSIRNHTTEHFRDKYRT